VERDGGGKFIPVPEKLRNQFVGPFKMIGWAGERYCRINVAGIEKIYNVNRLIKHHIWDAENLSTDTTQREREQKISPRRPPEIGEIIVFPMECSEKHRCIFGMGKILEIKGKNNIFFQWYGNAPRAEARKSFKPGWVDLTDNKGYYSFRKIHASHPAWTNEDTLTNIGIDSVIVSDRDIVDGKGRIETKFREMIEIALGERIPWGK